MGAPRTIRIFSVVTAEGDSPLDLAAEAGRKGVVGPSVFS